MHFVPVVWSIYICADWCNATTIHLRTRQWLNLIAIQNTKILVYIYIFSNTALQIPNNITLSLSNNTLPVSYTHLDVYKRQIKQQNNIRHYKYMQKKEENVTYLTYKYTYQDVQYIIKNTKLDKHKYKYACLLYTSPVVS